MIKKKMELPMDQISNSENKNMYLVRANYSTDSRGRQIYGFRFHRLDD